MSEPDERIFVAGVAFPQFRSSRAAASFARLRDTLVDRMRPGEGYFPTAAYGLFYERAESAEEAHALLVSRFGEFEPQLVHDYDVYDSDALSRTHFSVEDHLDDRGDVFCAPLISLIVAGHELPCCTLEEVGAILAFDVERFLLPEGIVAAPIQSRTVDFEEEEEYDDSEFVAQTTMSDPFTTSAGSRASRTSSGYLSRSLATKDRLFSGFGL